MKRFFIIIVSFLILSGCYFDSKEQDEFLSDSYSGHNLYYSEDFALLKTEKDIFEYIDKKIDYKKIKGFQNPEITLKSGYGDCKDYAILYLNITYFVLNEKYSIGSVSIEDRKILKGGEIDHCIVVRQNETQIEPQTGEDVDYDLCYIHSFDEVFN